MTTESLSAQVRERDAQIRRLEAALSDVGGVHATTLEAGAAHQPAGTSSQEAPASSQCVKMRNLHGVVVGETWGSLSIEDQQRWTDLSCDRVLASTARGASPAPAPAGQSVPPPPARLQSVQARREREGDVVRGSGAPTSVLADQVLVPEGDELPQQLRHLPRGTDLFISFASASMAPFALNWVANLRRSGVKQMLLGTLDEKMLTICKEQGIMVRACARPDLHSQNAVCP